MKIRYLSVLILVFWWSTGHSQVPEVFSDGQPDLIQSGLNQRAALAFKVHQIPPNLTDWEKRKEELRSTVIAKTGVRTFTGLPLNYQETASHQLDGVTIKNIYFQTRPGVYATANLYIPSGEGPFPAVITMMGHSSNGRLYDVYQAIGQSLAKNGYVSLHMDPWGAGERTTIHGEFEYHGAHLGASLFDVGESLMGMQITDNRRGVDLLSSLPFVDPDKIGATGASGGGNQTMWLAALDDRIKAAMPVVSVGTFQSYIMASNCICESLVEGLTFAEESEILGMVAPRALKLVNAGQEKNKAFIPEEMERSYHNAQTIFNLYHTENKLASQVFDMTHGYHPEVREAVLGWMDLHLKGKGNGDPRPEGNIELLTSEELMTFDRGKRPVEVMSTAEFCSIKGEEIRNNVLAERNMNLVHKKSELKTLLKIPGDLNLRKVHNYGRQEDWNRYALEVTDGYLIPVLIHESPQKRSEYVVIAHHKGKSAIPSEVIEKYMNTGKNIVLIDFWGLGESNSAAATRLNGSSLPAFHTLSRSMLWLGESMQGHWVRELEIVLQWLKKQQNADNIDIHAYKDLAPAVLFYAAMNNGVNQIEIEDAPISYLFDEGVTENFYSMAIHVPGMLKWGDLSLVTAMSDADVKIESPRTFSGKQCSISESNEFLKEYKKFRSELGTNGSAVID